MCVYCTRSWRGGFCVSPDYESRQGGSGHGRRFCVSLWSRLLSPGVCWGGLLGTHLLSVPGLLVRVARFRARVGCAMGGTAPRMGGLRSAKQRLARWACVRQGGTERAPKSPFPRWWRGAGVRPSRDTPGCARRLIRARPEACCHVGSGRHALHLPETFRVSTRLERASLSRPRSGHGVGLGAFRGDWTGAFAHGLLWDCTATLSRRGILGSPIADAFRVGSALLFALPGMVVAARLLARCAAGVIGRCGDFRTSVLFGSSGGVMLGGGAGGVGRVGVLCTILRLCRRRHTLALLAGTRLGARNDCNG